MDLKELKKLITLFEQRNIAELEYEEGDVRVRLRKELPVSQSLPAPRVEPQVEIKTTQVAPAQPTDSPSRSTNLIPLRSPIVGTFYRAPAPDTSPYVDLGDVVKKGQVMCIIEAMKVMNEIEAECSGRVSSVLAENAQPVEFGEALFLIEPLAQAEVAG